jgi:hypothetical protein
LKDFEKSILLRFYLIGLDRKTMQSVSWVEFLAVSPAWFCRMALLVRLKFRRF